MSRLDPETLDDSLDRRAVLELAVADGLATPDERAELLALGGSLDAHLPLAQAIAELLRPSFLPDLAPDVMAQVAPQQAEQDQQLSQALAELLAAGESPEMAAEILAALQLEADPLSDLLNEALSAPPVDLSADIFASLGLPASQDEDEDEDEAQGAEIIAFPAPAPAAAPAASPALQPAANTTPLRWRPAAVLAMAAAAVLAVVVGQGQSDPLDFQIAAVNTVAIEELVSGDQVFVQVMQMDEGAPTIIFIDELSDDVGGIPL